MVTTITTDPGPLARFKAVIADENTISVLVQRLTAGETLKDIAKAWQIPYGKLAEWITEDRDRAAKYSAALAIWADALAQECVDIADHGTDSHHRDKLRIETRLRLAGKWDRQRYGDQVAHNVNVKDERPQLEREEMLLETARAVGFVLATADQIRLERELNPLVPAPKKPEAPQQSEEKPSDGDLI